MEALSRRLSFLLFLWSACSGFAGEPCRGFKHLENGRTFFRFKGLYATFTCNPGFRIHGHHTSSCVSGQWVREPPVCVASGCPRPGRVQHGTAVVNEDGSFVVFSCSDGYRLYGSPLSYCKGKTWSSPKPVCKESDIMKPKPKVVPSSNIEKKLHPRAPSSLKDHFKSHYNTASKDAYLEPALPVASYPKSHNPGGLLLKSKLAQPQRRAGAGRKQSLQISAAARPEFAAGVNRNMEATEELTGPQQMGITAAAAARAALTTPGPVLGPSTKEPPVLTTTRKHKMDGEVSESVSVSVPVKAGVLLGKERKKVVPSPTVSVSHQGPSERSTAYVTETTSPLIEVSDKILDSAPQTGISDKSVDDFRTGIHGTSAAPRDMSVSIVTPLYTQNKYSKKLDSIAGGIRKIAGHVQISGHLSYGLEDTAEPKQGSLHLGDEPLLSTVTENKEDDMEERQELSEKDERPEQRNDGIAHIAVTSPEKLSSLLQPTRQAFQPSDQTPVPQLTSDHISPSSSKPDSSSSSMLQTIRFILTDLNEMERPGVGVEVSSVGPKGGSHLSFEVLTGATPLQPTLPAMETPDTTPTSLLSLSRHQNSSITQSRVTNAHMQIGEASMTERGMKVKSSPAPRHQHQPFEDHSHEMDSSTLTLPGLLIPSTAPTTHDARTNNLAPRSDAESSPPSPHPPEPEEHEAFTTARLPALPIKKRRPVCPYPPLPAHGTFYFRTLEKPAPLQYKHYIQYACYAGYTLANGDVYSYCQQNATWSGITPVCLEVRPCLLNNGGCSQLCVAGLHQRAQCHCREGFLLLEDQRTCRDIDECVEERHQCQQACVNTFGSFKCSCRTGFQLAEDGKTCVDTSECATAPGQAGCEWKCVNLSGSHQCICPRGFRRHPDGRRCIDINECDYSNGGCSHICKNLRGGYKCICPPSLHISLSNRKKCLTTTV